MPQSAVRSEYEQKIAKYEKQDEASTECPIPDRNSLAYVTEVFDRIEDCGTRYFPKNDGIPVYGTTRAIFLIAPDGTLLASAIVRSSGIPALDQHALRVVTASAPFGEVPKSILDASFTAVKVDATFTFKHEAKPSSHAKPRKKCKL